MAQNIDTTHPATARAAGPGSGQIRAWASEEQFRLMVQQVRDYAIFLMDPLGVVLSWNAGAEFLKGYRAEEIIGKHFSVFYTEEEVRAGVPVKELELARSAGSVELEGWRLRKDGSRFWASVIITALHDASGALTGFGKVTRFSLINTAGAALAKSHLNRGITVGFWRLDLRDAIIGHIEHCYRNGSTVFGKDARHADLASNKA